jgi:hypothetical protein
MTALSAALPRDADEVLPFLTKEALQTMARSWRLDVKNPNKETLIRMLSQTLLDPSRVESAVQSLAPRERAALDALILNGGRLTVLALTGQLESQGLIESRPQRSMYSFSASRREGSPSRVDSTKLEDILARLGALGLAFPWPPGTGGMLNLKTPSKLVVIPEPVLALLPPVALTIPSAPEPHVVTKSRPDAVLRELLTVVGAIRREPIELTKRGLIPKRSLVKLARSLAVSESELGYPTFLTQLATSAGLLTVAGGKLQEGSRTEQFLKQPRAARLQQLFRLYVNSEQWSELVRISDLSVGGAVAGPHLARARRRFLAVLQECPPGHWFQMDHVIDLMRRSAYEFLIPRERHDPYGYYFGYPFNPYSEANLLGVTFNTILGESEGWSRVEGGFIRAVVSEPLFWLGLVDLGSASADAEPEVFRLTEVGAALLHDRTPEMPQPAPNVVVQPNFQVFAFEPTGEDVLFQLDRLAERVSVQQAIEYRITRESIYSAQQSGMEANDILSYLDEVSTVPIPQNVRRSIEEWVEQNNRVVVRRRASLLQTVDAAALDALYARADVASLLGRRVAPTAALVAYSNLAAVNAALVNRDGPIPALSEGNDSDRAHTIQVGEDGSIVFLDRLPSVYVERRVRAVADADENGTYRLTRSSLRRAARTLGSDEIVNALSHLQGAPLGDEVTALIHRWTKYWGSATLAETVLLQVESSDILEAMFDAPDLRPHLQRLHGATTSALVRVEALETVRAALEERGIELRTEFTTVRKR